MCKDHIASYSEHPMLAKINVNKNENCFVTIVEI